MIPRSRSVLALAATLASAPAALAQQMIALTTGNRLVTFDLGAPGNPQVSVAVTGLGAGESLLGIDFRPANNRLYGLGSTSRLYQIDATTGAATAVGPVFTTLLSGTEFGFDFNPVADRVRIVSNTRQTLRIHPDTGALAAVDGTLTFAPTDPNAGRTPNCVASAYTNNLGGATSTTLYNIDSSLDLLVTQNPPNTGVLNTVGSLGVNVVDLAAFDIAGSNGSAFAVFRSPGGGVVMSNLFRIDLTSGAATFLGTVGTSETVRGMTIVPTPGAVTFGLASPGCQGPSAIGVNRGPVLGDAGFAVTCANAPPSTSGLLAKSPRGLTTPINLSGLLIHLDPTAPLWFFLAVSAADGSSAVNLPIPRDPSLVGARLFSQFLWPDACTAIGLSGSNGLQLTVQQS